MEALKLCVEKGADVNARNSMGITAVIGAANRGSDDQIEYLVQRGAKLDVKDKEGRTPLDWAGGVFLATNPPEEKPSTQALIKKLMAKNE
jgi:ankyrin repeat protein